MDILIVSRHAGAVEWLKQHGIEGAVKAQVVEDDVRGKHVIGTLPLHLAALCEKVTIIDLPRITPEQRGKDLTPVEMDVAGAVLNTYRVQKI